MPEQPSKHGEQHRPGKPGGPDGIRYAVWHIALSGDREIDDPVIVEDHVFRAPLAEDMDTYKLKRVAIGAGEPSSSGAVTVHVENETQGFDIITSDLSLPGGATYQNEEAKIPDDPDDALAGVEGDIIRFDVTGAGAGDCKGLKVILVWW